ncbi:putative gustatory receptor 2a [Sabethes cyaneus]|uniref:putative gustatory receptor 2a n=1 Tax=Sabethes cyaneus TaxID=53552 RepID=UPI00237DAB18|nr:putative gustatory receptor 2a [Sabethes cyaneus]
MGMLRLQNRLLWLLSLFGVLLFPNLLAKGQTRYWYYTCHVIIVQTIFISIGVMIINMPWVLNFAPTLDKTSTFVLIVAYCHWHIIITSIALHSALNKKNYEQIVDTLKASDLIYSLLQAFNNYYGQFFLKMCMTAFVRCCLAFYFLFLASKDLAIVIEVLKALCLYTWWHCTIIFILFSICNSATTAVNETVLCMRFFQDCNIVDSKITRQINRCLLKNLHKKMAFRAVGFFDVNRRTIHMVLSSVITYFVILIQFQQLDSA